MERFVLSPLARIFFSFLIVLICGFGLPNLKVDNSPDSFFVEGDDTLIKYKRFQVLFQSDEYAFITLEVPEDVSDDFRNAVVEIESALTKIDNVIDVQSLVSARHVIGESDGIVVNGYLENIAGTDIHRKIKEGVNYPNLEDVFVSRDAKYWSIIVRTQIIHGEMDYKIKLRNDIIECLNNSRLSKLAPAIVGTPILDSYVVEIVSRETGLFGATVFVIVGLGLYFIFRSFLAAIVPLFVVLVSTIASLGVMGWLGYPVTLLTPILPSFLISVGVSPSIFFFVHYFTHSTRDAGLSVTHVRNSALAVIGPCFLASMTTAAALFAFSGSDISSVKQIGLILGAGLLMAFFLTFFLGEAILELIPINVSESQRQRLQVRGRLLGIVDRFSIAYSKRIFVIWLVSLVVFGVAIFGNLKVDFYYLGSFKESTHIRDSYETSDRRMPRSTSFEIVLDADKTDAFKDPKILEKIDNIQKEVDAYPFLSVKTSSLVGLVKEVNKAMNGGSNDQYAIPETKEVVSQLLFLYEISGSDELKQVVTSDYKTSRISVLLKNVEDSELEKLELYIKEKLDQEFNEGGVSYEITGLNAMWLKVHSYLLDTQVDSVILSFLFTSIVFIIFSRSLVVGLVFSIVNASVIVFVLGVMSIANLPLNPHTVLIASIAIGILDDDTLHFYAAIKKEIQAGSTFHEAVSVARSTAGAAIYSLAFCLIIGFSIYAFSSVQSLTTFGILTTLVIVVGAIWETIVMPSCLEVLHSMGFISGFQGKNDDIQEKATLVE